MADEPLSEDISPVGDRKILIIYGSETGNSQDAAGDLEDIAERLRFQTDVLEMNEVGLRKLIEYPLVIFVISTTGQGQLPQNAQKFWRQLRSNKLPSSCLRQVKFTTFGLGDSSYTKFNWAVRKLHKRLEQLGAQEFYHRGEADERHEDGIDGAFLPWSFSLRSHLLKEYPLPEDIAPIPSDVQLPPKIVLRLSTTAETMRPELGADGTVLDRKAAQFSHIDNLDSGHEQRELEAERLQEHGLLARLSEHTASKVPGGIDKLDRPNVLRDAPSKYSLEDDQGPAVESPPEDILPIPKSFTATIQQNKRVTPQDHWQDTRHLCMRVEPQAPFDPDSHKTTEMWPPGKETEKIKEAPYCDPGDVVVIYPKNIPGDVQTLIERMGWSEVADRPFEHYRKRRDGINVNHAPKGCYPMENTTLRQLLTNNYDIHAIPKRMFFTRIMSFTDDPMHKERLGEFGNSAFTDEFYDYTSRPRRSILEVLMDFPSVKIPYQWVPSVFPIIRGREYSIASGGSLSLDKDKPDDFLIETLIALVKYKTVLRKTRQGLCSRYIETLKVGTQVRITIVKHDGLPMDERLAKHPVLAIAPGTGVAPIRAFFWERALQERHGQHVLFFGGRNRHADFYFEKEWEGLDAQVFTAFSRDQREKIYVQDVIRKQAKVVCELFTQRPIVCVCGSSGKMPLAVRLALKDALVLGGLCENHEEAQQRLESTYIWEEVW